MKLLATIKKDLRILLRDRIGLTLMFGMPILLVLNVTSIQNNAFQPFSKNQVLLFVLNKDTGRFSQELTGAVDRIGLFRLEYIDPNSGREDILFQMWKKDGQLTVVIPPDFSRSIAATAKEKAGKPYSATGPD